MSLTVNIDTNSGFCAGVIRAIDRAENFLSTPSAPTNKLFSLGAIVHNDSELTRLEEKGLIAIDYDDLEDMVNAKGKSLLIRAHGEPPSTYKKADTLGFKVIDCTCPVVLALQREIKKTYEFYNKRGIQIIIFGKIGHAEVLGLSGQVSNNAIIIDSYESMLEKIESKVIDLRLPIEIFSQTTKGPTEYKLICSKLEEIMAKENGLSIELFREKKLFNIHHTICSQVANRHSKLTRFALENDIIIFVSGRASSNGKILCELCKSVNIRTYHIESASDIKAIWFRDEDKVGICGATSTPRWLLDEIKTFIDDKISNNI